MTPEEKEHIWKALTELKASNKLILGILETNIKLDEIGLIKEVHLNTKAIATMKREEAVRAGKNAVYAAFGTIVVLVCWAIIQAIITKNIK